MSYFSIFLKLVPMIISLVKQAEDWFSEEEKSGEKKKAAVLESVETLVDGITDASTGGQKTTWEKLKPLISTMVDVVCKFI